MTITAPEITERLTELKQLAEQAVSRGGWIHWDESPDDDEFTNYVIEGGSKREYFLVAIRAGRKMLADRGQTPPTFSTQSDPADIVAGAGEIIAHLGAARFRVDIGDPQVETGKDPNGPALLALLLLGVFVGLTA